MAAESRTVRCEADGELWKGRPRIMAGQRRVKGQGGGEIHGLSDSGLGENGASDNAYECEWSTGGRLVSLWDRQLRAVARPATWSHAAGVAGKEIGMTASQSQTAEKALFQERWDRIQAAMDAARIDALIVASRGVIGQFGNVFYLCGYTPLLRVSYGVLTRSGEPVLFVPSYVDQALALDRGIVTEIRTSAEMDVMRSDVSMAQAVASEIKARDATRVGIVGLAQIVPIADHAILRQELRGIELLDASGLYARVKEIKTSADITHVKAAFALAQRAYDAAPGLLAPGTRAQDVVAEVESVLRRATGSEALVFVDSAPLWVRRNTDTVFAAGDLVMVLVEVATAAGYFVEQGGLFSVGEPRSHARIVADACYSALAAIGTEIRPGAAVAAATEIHETIGGNAGLELRLALGHGVGVDHDLPTLYRTDTGMFKEGQLISVHPYYWDDATSVFGGVSDAFYVTADGSQRMGSHDYELTIV